MLLEEDRKGGREGQEELRAKWEETDDGEEGGKWEERQTEETWSDGEAGGVERQLKAEKMIVRGGREGKNKEGRVGGGSSYFNIKQHGEEFNIPFTAPFACL